MSQLVDKLNDDIPTRAEEWGVTQALSMWQSAAEECGKVPGYSYVQEKSKDDAQQSEKGETKGKFCTNEEIALSAQEWEELWVDDREYVIKPKRKSHKSRYAGSTASSMPKFSFSRMDDKTFHRKSQAPHRTEIQAVEVDDDVLKEMEDVTIRLQDRLGMDNYDFCNAVEDAGTEMIQIVKSSNPSNYPLPLTPVPKAIEDTDMYQALHQTSLDVRTESSTIPSKATPRSALKGTRTLTSPNLQLVTPCRSPYMKLNFSDHAIVFSNNDSPSTPETSTQKPHNKHTDAESSRLRRLYQRTSNFYNASTAQWASPKGYEKMETSFTYDTWNYLDAANRREEKKLSTVKSVHSLNDVISKKAALSKTVPAPSDPELTAALNALEDDLAEAMLDDDNAVAQTGKDTTNKSHSEQGMQVILHPTANTSTPTKHTTHPITCLPKPTSDLNKQLILRPKQCELSVIHQAPASTSPRAPVHRIKRSPTPPESPAPKPAPRAESAFTQPVTEHLGGGHCKQGGKVHCGLMFGVAERESER
ncbi:hypothetical protein FB567DRAFT_549706 [Paraphoma chrysanthemicola]|uniref:Uncharacterized protein n=1 Tax=Paraphoma chrysanthemicola TaxID=798071 RepID=A0A8K0R6A3_9PLEO|nr:hypothetical protein FB567DRAFT_549706 [Paraphoma chrysanthemicola]